MARRDKAIARAVERLSFAEPDRSEEEHERYVRAILDAIDEYLVPRHLYDAVVAELRRAKE